MTCSNRPHFPGCILELSLFHVLNSLEDEHDLFASPTPTGSMGQSARDQELAELHLPPLPSALLIDATGLQVCNCVLLTLRLITMKSV